jgi:ribosomal protein S18 acetylase RimI-like enzyme
VSESGPDLTLRPIREEDEEFLFRLYASTREDELAGVSWSDETRAAFLRQQFAAQRAGYAETYAGATFDLVLANEVPAGRLYVARWPREVRLVDISFLPAYRRLGLGTRLIRRLQDEAAASGSTLTIHVEMFNPALRLYQRLGFTAVATDGPYWFMEWRAAAGAAAGST